MSAFSVPKVKRTAVFIRELKDGQPVLVRRPYDFVDLNFGTDEPTRNKRYVQLFPYSSDVSFFGAEKAAVYNDLMILDTPPSGDPIKRCSVI
jgi:hypothetical protein